MSTSTSALPSPSPASRLRRTFVGPNGLRTGWRLLLFLVIAVGLEVLPALVAHRVVPGLHAWVQSQPHDSMNPSFMVFAWSWQTFFLYLAVVIMTKIEKRSFASYGLPLRSAFGSKFWLGFAVGLGAVALLMALIATLGGYSASRLALSTGDALKYACIWGYVFLLVAFFEEMLYRGYAQYTLASGIGFWPAAVLLSLLMAAVHVLNPGERWPGILSVFCYAMLAAFTLRRTGNLWFVIGLHAVWDWAHLFLFSVPIAGNSAPGQLLHASLQGPRWLTGGTVGPDGSVFVFVILLGIFVLVNWIFPQRDR